MGADTFVQRANGKTAQEAFDRAVEHAQYEHGHGGYTGTIAEKHSFVEIRTASGPDPDEKNEKVALQQAYNLAQKLINDGDPRIDDKWGPAGCIQYAPGKYLFFGWASS